METFGRFRVITTVMVAERQLTATAPTAPLRLADLTDRTALGDYGVTGDVSTGTDYVPAQEWALRFWESGFDGIYYAARHDPEFTERSIALFGSSSDMREDEHKSFESTTRAIPQDALDELAREFGVLVVPMARLRDRGP